METLLAILLAAATVACARLWTGRRELLARERRLREEIGGLKRSSQLPLPSPSSPDLRPLFGDALPESPAPPDPVPAALLPSPPEPARPSPALPPHLVGEAGRHRDALAVLDEKLSRLHLPESAAPSHPAPPQAELDPTAERLASAAARIASAIEPFVDQGTRLRSDLASSEGAALRVLESLEAALPLAREAARQAEGLSSLVSSLSGLADRLNLLSLDTSLGEGGAAPAAAGREASAEIRSLFDETRSFARTLAARVRNATESARRAEEGFAALRGTADGARDRAATASGRGAQLASVALELEAAAEGLRGALDEARLEWEKQSRLRAALEQRLSMERQAAARKEREAALGAEVEEAARETVRRERQAAEALAEALGTVASRTRSESP